MNIDSFFNFFNGIYCDYDGADGDQCFDLANNYSRWIGGPHFSGATADLIYQQPGDFYEQIPNTIDNFPQKGDIVVFNWPHVGIATGNNTDANQLELLEQNDPENSNCHIKVYPNYSGVIGWLRPKTLPVTPNGNGTFVDADTFTKLVHNSSVTDQLNTYLQLPANSDWLPIVTKLNELRQALVDAQNSVSKDNQTITIDDKKILDLTNSVNALNTQLETFNESVQNLKTPSSVVNTPPSVFSTPPTNTHWYDVIIRFFTGQ